LIDRLARVLKPEHSLSAPEEEVNQLAMISAEEGSIMPYEADLVRNVLHLDKVTTRDIMTPRPVVMKLPSDMTLREVFEKVKEFTYSRIPVYDCDDPETWKGVVFSRDILAGLARDQFDTKLETLCSPIYFVSETTPGNVLLKSFLKRRSHLFGVADEYGDITGIVTLEDVIESMLGEETGIVTLEDVIESMLGEEIVDEVDCAVDMQDVAQRRKRERNQGESASDDNDKKKSADA
jgi:CBS domain containing-hemolysin-like protein